MDNKERLLNPGFAGDLSPEELIFIKSELKISSRLRRQCGFRPGAKQLNEDYIRYVAKHGVPKDRRSVLASLRKSKKKVAAH